MNSIVYVQKTVYQHTINWLLIRNHKSNTETAVLYVLQSQPCDLQGLLPRCSLSLPAAILQHIPLMEEHCALTAPSEFLIIPPFETNWDQEIVGKKMEGGAAGGVVQHQGPNMCSSCPEGC